MSSEEQVSSYRPQFRQAYKEVRENTTGDYVQVDLKLKESADLGPWDPDQSVLKYVPNISDIKIEMISETTDIEQVIKLFIDEKSIGLVVLGQEVSRQAKPSLIVMTTSDIYFVMDPNANNRGLEVLKRSLHEPGLTVWTTNGLFEADSLYHNYKIKLQGSNAQCCLGLHLQLMTRLSALPNHALTAPDELMRQHMYPNEALILARRDHLRLISYHQLIKTWLSTDNERIFDLDPAQLIHLDTRPLSLTAKNLILKRCCLVLKLAQALEFYSLTEFSTMNRRTLDCLSDPSHPHTILMKKIMEEDEKKGIVSHIYLSHLDEPFISTQPEKPLISLSSKEPDRE